MILLHPSLRILAVCLMALILAALPAGAPAQVGRIESHQPTLIEAGVATNINIVVRNVQMGTTFRLVVTGVSPSWSNGAPTPAEFFLANNRTQTVQVPVTPSFSLTNGVLNVRLDGFDEFGDLRVGIATAALSIEGLAPPGEFFIIAPQMEAELNSNFFITWSQSMGVDTYKLSIYERQGSTRGPLHLEFVDLGVTSVNMLPSQFTKGGRYEFEVEAFNRIASRKNRDGPRIFRIAPPLPVGDFTMTAPANGAELLGNPTLAWTTSVNAINYTLIVVPVVDGEGDIDNMSEFPGYTGNSAALPITLTPGRFYDLYVRAVGEGDERIAVNAPARVYIRSIADFDLGLPKGDFQSRQPVFTWQRALGADGYTLRVTEAESGAEVYSIQVPQEFEFETVTQPSPSSFLLKPDTQYDWQVVAFNSIETRVSRLGGQSFRTTPVQGFDLREPAHLAQDVPQVPTFTWAPLAGSIYVYSIDIAPANAVGDPNLGRVTTRNGLTGDSWTSDLAPLDLGATYFWRMRVARAADLELTAQSHGTWRAFTVTPFGDATFSLLAPANGSEEVSLEPILTWEPVPGAEGYTVFISIPEVLTFEPIVLDIPSTGLDWVDVGRRLNGDTTYAWMVVARIGDSMLDSAQSFQFTTRARNDVGPCDFLDHLLGLQYLSQREKSILGWFQPGDIALYVNMANDPEMGPCPPAE